MLSDQKLLRPAAALSRSVHEAQIRFEYLADNEHELRNWMEWLMSRECHRQRDHLVHDARNDPKSDWEAQSLMRSFEALLGRRPKKPPYPWRSNSMMLQNIAGHLPNKFDKRLFRRLIEYPSEYVHIALSSNPREEAIVGTTELSVLLTIRRAMMLCRDKHLTSGRVTQTANEIVTLYDGWIDRKAHRQPNL